MAGEETPRWPAGALIFDSEKPDLLGIGIHLAELHCCAAGRSFSFCVALCFVPDPGGCCLDDDAHAGSVIRVEDLCGRSCFAGSDGALEGSHRKGCCEAARGCNTVYAGVSATSKPAAAPQVWYAFKSEQLCAACQH